MVHYIHANEEQLELASGLRQILDKELAPYTGELDKASGYPMEVHRKLAEAGYFAMGIPEEWGGLGMNAVTQGIIAEELAQVDAGFAFGFFFGGSYFNRILMTSMPDEVKQEWADRILSGEAIGSLCMTEPGAGSDATAMRTTAVKDGSEWIINGSKCFITCGPYASFYLVTAWTDRTKKASEGVTMFFVERERGVQVGRHEDKMGIRLTETCEVIFDNVRVPEDHVVGEVGKGFVINMQNIARSRCFHGCFANGLAQHAIDAAVEYAKERRQFGKRIIDHEGLGFLIADMIARTEASRALVYQTLEAIDAGKDVNATNYPYITKLVCADNAMQTAIDAVQVFGGYGYMHDYPVEKLMRDAKIFQIFGGTTQIQRRTIAKRTAGRDPQWKK